MAWDLMSAWPDERRWIWLTVAGWVLMLRGPAFIQNLHATGSIIPDFYQEYASARNWVEGSPIYADHRESVPRYLGGRSLNDRSLVLVNAHPPTSVLLALPLARFRFDIAFLAWNLASLAALAASLAIVQRVLRLPFSAWSLAPLFALLLLCFPLWEHCQLGQLTLIILLLILGSWAAERSGRPKLAGVLLGSAACIKLFPCFLFVYYALRGQWRVLIAGLLTIIALSALTAAILGIEAYHSYFLTVLPDIQWFRVGWANNSLWGFWSRLFDPAPERVRDRSLTEPLYYSPLLATALSLMSAAAVTGLLAWRVHLDPGGQKRDLTFAMAITAMLLVSPICWEHYLLLLLAPLAIVWMELPAPRSARAAFLAIVAAFWLGYPVTWTAFGLNGRTATPIDSIGILSYQFYALLGFFGLTMMILRRGDAPGASPWAGTHHTLAFGAVVMAALWIHVVRVMWQRYGLFYFLGVDFGIYRSIAAATLAEGPAVMYDLDRIAPYERELMPYHGPWASAPMLGPGPYPAVYILPFLPLAACSPPLGFLIWVLVGAALAFVVVRGMSERFPERGWGLIASGMLSYPIAMALICGQLTMLFFYGFYHAYRSLEDGREFRAGLWSGALYLKPQYVVFLFLVFLLKRRWHALGGLTLAGVIVLLGSLAIAGLDGFRSLLETLREMSSFHDAIPIIGSRGMINWRGVLVSFLPRDVSDQTGRLVTAICSILTAGTLPLIWRGAWEPRGQRFSVQMLATVIVMMLASYHNHVHSAALLLVPGLAVAAQGDRPRYLLPILTAGLFAPVFLYFFTASMMYVSWLLVALMLAALGVIVHAELAPALGAPAAGPADGERPLPGSAAGPAPI